MGFNSAPGSGPLSPQTPDIHNNKDNEAMKEAAEKAKDNKPVFADENEMVQALFDKDTRG